MIERWCFTFPVGHILSKYYICIEGDYQQARERMFNSFGTNWSFQYDWDSFREQIEKYGYKEIKGVIE